MIRIAIHGLGRIGRLVVRQLAQDPAVRMVALNDLGDIRSLAHLIKYDSVHRRAPFEVSREKEHLVLAGQAVPCFQEADPDKLPFSSLGADLVVDCTGSHPARTHLARHLQGSVRHVIAGYAVGDADITLLPGRNDGALDPTLHQVISTATGTAHALSLLMGVLEETCGVERALATVVHAYTSDQKILDLPHGDLRKARAAAASMIPAPTASVEILTAVAPQLEGRLSGMAIRVPSPDVSLVDLTAHLARPSTPQELIEAYRQASLRLPGGILEVLEDELVSADLVGCEASCAFDPFLIRFLSPTFVKVHGWFDNEWAYARRIVDLIHRLEGAS